MLLDGEQHGFVVCISGVVKIEKVALRQKDKGIVLFPQIQKSQKWT